MRSLFLKAALLVLAPSGPRSQVVGFGGVVLPGAGGDVFADYPEVAPDAPLRGAPAADASDGRGARLAPAPLAGARLAGPRLAAAPPALAPPRAEAPALLEAGAAEPPRLAIAQRRAQQRTAADDPLAARTDREAAGRERDAARLAGAAAAAEARRLAEENEALRSHLERWRRLGERVVERDRRLEEALAGSGILRGAAPPARAREAAAPAAPSPPALLGVDRRVGAQAAAPAAPSPPALLGVDRRVGAQVRAPAPWRPAASAGAAVVVAALLGAAAWHSCAQARQKQGQPHVAQRAREAGSCGRLAGSPFEGLEPAVAP